MHHIPAMFREVFKPGRIVWIVAAFAAMAWHGQALAMDVSGTYKGFYQYYDQRRNNIVGRFTIALTQSGNRVSGVIEEPRTDFGPMTPTLLSDFVGEIKGTEEQFTITYVKTYRYDKHTVSYRGQYKSIQGEIQGEWNIGNYKGFFKISEVRPAPDLDMEEPRALLLEPIIAAEKTTRGVARVEAAKPITSGAMRVSGLAADNVKVARVLVNGQEARLAAPTTAEGGMIQGNALRFTANVPAAERIELKLTDVSGNVKDLSFALAAPGTAKPGNVPAKAPAPVGTPSGAAGQTQPGLPPTASPGTPGQPEAGSASLAGQTGRSQEAQPGGSTAQNPASGIYANKIAVVIGVNKYKEWPPLEFAVNDAASIKKYLEKEQGFSKVLQLTDEEATRTAILKTLGYELPRLAGPEDGVVVYFAGHGHTESLRDGDKEGYIIPVDAGREDSFLSAISMRQLRSIASRVKAKHVLFVMDSCYSGTGFTRSAGVASSESDYIDKIASFRAVQMITAGGMNEQVQEERGHGLFTRTFLDALGGTADLDKDGFITASELGTFLRSEVTKRARGKQTPGFGRFEGEGEFVFAAKP